MNAAVMFHMLEPVLMDLYNAKERTDNEEKKRQVQEWIDTLEKGDPSPEEFEKIINSLKEL